MERRVKDRNILNRFVEDFVGVLVREKIRYIVVSGFVAIAHGRSRGTEDIDIIIEKIPRKRFEELHTAAGKAGFECIQGKDAGELYKCYFEEGAAIRYVRKGGFIPEIELKMAKDALDEKQLQERVKLPLTGLQFYFSDIETNIAFKEELLKSPKDMEDARHLRIIYAEKIDEKRISEIKKLIKEYRLNG